MPLTTVETLVRLAQAGATVVFEGEAPSDVPGLGDWEARRAKLAQALGGIRVEDERGANRKARRGKGTLNVWKAGDLTSVAEVRRETLFDTPA